MKPKALLFDLGGVLVDFVGPERLSDMLNNRFSMHQIRQMWPESPALTKFELGKVSPQVFAKEFILEWGFLPKPPKICSSVSR